MATTTRQVTGYRALHSILSGSVGSPTAYGQPLDDGYLIPLSIHERVAPEVTTAKLELDLAALTCMPWEWKRFIAHDDRVTIVSNHTDPAERHVAFDGFVVDVDMTGNQRSASVIVTCAGRAHRLRSDIPVVGRIMLGQDGDPWWYNGLRCEFNADGKPNKHPSARIAPDGALTFDENDPSPVPIPLVQTEGHPLFTYDGDPAAQWWTPREAFGYLLAVYNATEPWLTSPDLSSDSTHSVEPVVVDVDQMDLWSALAALADRAGYDVAERIANDGAGGVSASLAVVRKHAGTERTVRRQPLPANGIFEQLDLDRTNVFAMRIAENSAGCVARPIAQGGSDLVEVTVPLQKAWNPANLTVPAGGILTPSYSPTEATSKAAFYAKYHRKGTSFASYRNVGRLWDANTDGRYSTGGDFQLTTPDVGDLADDPAGSWPVMPYRPRPCLTWLPESVTTHGVLVEISYDGGTTWVAMDGYRVLHDRLAIWLSDEHMGLYIKPGGNPKAPNQADSLFYALANTPANVLMRMTCSVVAPYRRYQQASVASGGGTAFATRRFFDRGTAGQVRRVSTGSRFAGSGLPQDTASTAASQAALGTIANAIAATVGRRLIEASLPIEWPDEDLYLTDQVTRIDGIELDLSTAQQAVSVYPRIVGRDLFLTRDTWSMTLLLDTDRQAGIR